MNVGPMPRSAAMTSLGSLLAISLVGCSSEDTPDEPAGDAAAPADGADSSDENTATGECEFPDGLSEQLGIDRQFVLNLAMAEGDNLETVQSAGAPDPGTFRSVAEALDGLDLSGVPPNPQFDEPDDVVSDLNETADLLEAALAAGADTADPAWTALSEFYTQEFFVRHNASVGYYLTEAGCA